MIIPTYTQAQSSKCVESNGLLQFDDDNGENKIWVYVEKDMASEMQSCQGNYGQLTNEMMIYEVETAMALWNQESLGPVLEYAGTWDESCDSLGSKRPAITIEYYTGCKNVYYPGWGFFCQNSLATAGDSPCDDVTTPGDVGKITIWGDYNGNESYPPGNYAYANTCGGASTTDWEIAELGQSRSLKDTIAHELGHMLGSGHANSKVSPDTAIMESGNAEQNHLGTYDKHCSYQWYGTRVVFPATLESDTAGGWQSTANTFTGIDAQRGTRFGEAPQYFSESGPRFYAYASNRMQWGYGSIYGTNFPYSTTFSTGNPLYYLHVSPTLYTTLSTTYHTKRAITLDDESFVVGGSPSYEHPPYVDDTTYFSSYNDTSYSDRIFACTNSSCGLSGSFQSFLPLATAYDPGSDETIFARVDKYGRIWMYPGQYSGNPLTLDEGEIFEHQGVNTPADNLSPWDFRQRTDQPVGISCTADTSKYPYNCILAYVDQGMPTGRVVYTYFRINGDNVEWQGVSWERAGSRTATGVDAGINNLGRWSLVWHHADAFSSDPNTWNSIVIQDKSTSSYYSNWDTEIYIQRTNSIVDAPTIYSHHDNSESPYALVQWTEE